MAASFSSSSHLVLAFSSATWASICFWCWSILCRSAVLWSFFSTAALNSLLRLRIIKSASVILSDDNGPRFQSGMMSAKV